MKFTRYTDVKDFYRDTFTVLMKHEAQNVIPLGNIIIGNKGEDKTGWRDPVNWFMATVSDDGGIILTAVMTPPHHLTFYATDNVNNVAAFECLMDGMEASGITFPSVMAEKSLAELFVEKYAAKTGKKYKVEKSQRIYELINVCSDVQPGTVRLARESDMAFLPYWGEAFYYECFDTPLVVTEETAEAYRHIINNRKNRYIMEVDGTPVTMAGISRELETVCVVGPVYTPPYFRRRGYAAACVAAVSQIGLDKGFEKCVLYTDLANPISNSIYMKIGYVPICDSIVIRFIGD
ncbi:MAG: GNAT family N-acetyltransferase [Defluviitaleaceae bacterium]|nr:GNAT family N-acetyltransferase [Defluviitaleaceae bacterium]